MCSMCFYIPECEILVHRRNYAYGVIHPMELPSFFPRFLASYRTSLLCDVELTTFLPDSIIQLPQLGGAVVFIFWAGAVTIRGPR